MANLMVKSIVNFLVNSMAYGNLIVSLMAYWMVNLMVSLNVDLMVSWIVNLMLNWMVGVAAESSSFSFVAKLTQF